MPLSNPAGNVSINGTITVTATDLDIRDLSSATDSVLMYGSDDAGTTKRVIKTDAGGAIQVDLEVASVTVDNFPTEYALPTAQVSTLTPQINGITDTEIRATALPVSATDLDIRSLVSATDGVAIYGSDDAGTTKRIIKTDAGGAIQVDLEVASVEVSNMIPAVETGLATSAKQLADGHNVAVSNMIPAVETGLATSVKQLADDHNVTVSNMIPAVETGLATSAKQLADGHNVTVSNMIAPVETGLATSAKQLADGHAVVVSSGAITETNSGTIAGDTTSIDGKITACNTGAVVISSGAITETNSGDIKTAIEILDDIVQTEDDAHTTADKGVMSLGVRNDSGAALAGDGDYIPLTTDNTGALRVNVSTTGTQYAEDTPHTTGDIGDQVLAVRNDVLASLCDTDGDYTPLQVDAEGALYSKEVRTLSVTNATGSGAIATTTAVSANWKLDHVTIHLSAAPTTSQDISISIDANDGAAYDTVLLKQDLSASSATDIVYKNPVGDLILESGDEIAVAYTNTDGVTYGLRVVGEKI